MYFNDALLADAGVAVRDCEDVVRHQVLRLIEPPVRVFIRWIDEFSEKCCIDIGARASRYGWIDKSAAAD